MPLEGGSLETEAKILLTLDTFGSFSMDREVSCAESDFLSTALWKNIIISIELQKANSSNIVGTRL